MNTSQRASHRYRAGIADPAFAARFNQLAIEAGAPKTSKGLGALFGVSATMAWNYRNGEKIPAMATACRIAATLNCSVEYLLTGRGPKRPPPPQPTLDNFARLMPAHQQAVMAFIEALLECHP